MAATITSTIKAAVVERRRTGGRTNGWMEGIDGLKEERTYEPANEWMEGTDERTEGLADGRTDGQKDGQKDGRMDRRTDGWTEGRTDGQKDGRTDERTCGLTDSRTEDCRKPSINHSSIVLSFKQPITLECPSVQLILPKTASIYLILALNDDVEESRRALRNR